MTSFNAATAVEQMEYDFTKYIDGDEASGIIPEPTTDQMEAYFTSAKAIAKRVKGLQSQAKGLQDRSESGEISDEEMEQVLASMDSVSVKEVQSEMADLISALCSNTPSAETLLRLPYRVLQAFFGWVQGNLRPER